MLRPSMFTSGIPVCDRIHGRRRVTKSQSGVQPGLAAQLSMRPRGRYISSESAARQSDAATRVHEEEHSRENGIVQKSLLLMKLDAEPISEESIGPIKYISTGNARTLAKILQRK